MHRTIAQRDLRNDVARVLREAEAGTEFTVTVRGRPVARLGPHEPAVAQTDVDREKLRSILASPLDSADLAADLDAAEAPVDDPWPDP
ncbi:MAG: type II toxin-antitoxin system prevent-host-death family antitoxin [Actinomycetota bacterium]|jgi:prevent-host-death family protein|nr:type II toxin-antitoxin system prevent-host-death family antitoxin [Actinomycetota bacterium]